MTNNIWVMAGLGIVSVALVVGFAMLACAVVEYLVDGKGGYVLPAKSTKSTGEDGESDSLTKKTNNNNNKP